MKLTRNTVLLVISIIAFVLAAVAAEDDGEIIFHALTWVSIGLIALTATHLPKG